MDKVEQAKRRVNKLEVRIGVLKEKRKDLQPVLDQYKCKSVKDVKSTIKKLRKQRKKLRLEINDLVDTLDSALEKMEEDTDE